MTCGCFSAGRATSELELSSGCCSAGGIVDGALRVLNDTKKPFTSVTVGHTVPSKWLRAGMGASHCFKFPKQCYCA